MIAKSWLSRCWQWQIGGCVAIFGSLSVGVSEGVLAQIVPDNTLGAESSVVTPNVDIQGIQSDRIDGGATRGANLFHSFQEFNVGEGRGAYFANPTGIENILTRVTGGNPSNIFGRLGVLGGANLFLLNPHGIVFGPNASLDIQGSFLATTAERIQLGDSGYFSAAEPQASSLLSVSPGALFFNAVANQPSSIINRGNLSTGKHLTLSAGNLDLQGQLLSGGDLTLEAQDTVKVRDTVATPFLARTGGNLTIIGNGGIDILALNHPTQTPFVSGENLSLISDGIISGDARFSSGGSFSIRSLSGGLANFVSYYDPIISAEGDVDVAVPYTGTSLLVEATGNIRFQGDINITGPHTSTLPPGPDTARLNTTSALIMRSGQSTLAYGGVNSGTVPAYSTGAVPAGITLGGNVTLQPFNGAGGIVNLLAASGNVSTQGITTKGGAIDINSAGAITTAALHTRNNDNNGGAISLIATNGSINTEDLDSSSSSGYFGEGNGGAISLVATNGSINTGDLKSSASSYSPRGGKEGAISLIATNGSINTGDLDSYSYSVSGSAEGGAISLIATNGSINTGDLDSSSFSRNGRAKKGGNISLVATNGSINTGDLDSSSYSGYSSAENGGNISLVAINGSVNTGDLVYASSSGYYSNNGGNISLIATNGSITTGSLYSGSSTSGGNAGQGGAIRLTAANGSITTGSLYSGSQSQSNSGNAGQGGAIRLTAANDIKITGNLYSYSYSQSGTAGQGGAISLRTTGGDISGRGNQSSVLGSFSISEQGTAGNGGNVALEAKNNVSNLEILTLSSSSQSGAVQVTGLGDLLLTDTSILTSKQVTVPNPLRSGEFITLTVGGKGQSGNVDVSSLGNLTFNNSSIQSDTQGSDNAGNVTVNSPGLVTFNNSSIRSNTSSTGAAGSIGIEAGQGITLVGSNSELSALFAGTTNQGEAGNITLTTPELTLQNGAKIATTTASSSDAGAITLQSHPNGENLTINLEQNTLISASTSNQGTGGDIKVIAPEAITIRGKGQLSVETTGDGAAGDLRIDTQRLTIADGATISASTSSTNPNGIGGNITINATQSVDINQASLLARSTAPTQGADAGSITIETGQLTAHDGRIETSSLSSSGGDISITADKIRLYGDSDITTFVAQGAGGGGDIKLTADSILAFDDSDILAFAPGGTGGNITLETPAFFGENYRPAPRNTNPDTLDGNDRVDVNATGAVEGVITRPDTTFIQNSLTELPENQIDTDSLLANSCIVRRNQPTRGSFTITGTGGLPQRPGDAQMSTFPTVDIETLPSDDTSSTTNSNRPWQKGDPIVEPQGVYRLPNGKLVLSRECS